MLNTFKKLVPKKARKSFKFLSLFFILILKAVLAFNIVFISFNLIFSGRIFPNVSISGIDVSGLTPLEAKNLLSEKLKFPAKLSFVSENGNFDIDVANINLKYDPELTVYSAYNIFRTGNFLYDATTRAESIVKKRDLGIRLTYDETKLAETISVIAGGVAIEPVYPSLSFENEQVVVNPGKKGVEANIEEVKSDISETLTFVKNEPIEIKIDTVDPTLNSSEIAEFKKRAEALVGKKLILTFEFNNFVYSQSEMFSLLDPKGGYQEDQIEKIMNDLAKSIERNPQNPSFVFEGGRVKEFAPAKHGVNLDKEKFIAQFVEKLKILESDAKREESLPIAVNLTEPEVSTDEVNDLGIKELIGRGSSTFRGSIASRVFNVNLAATRVNGFLIKPGEEFSFNAALGDVSKLTGYKEAYVIKDGKTVLGDGGGVCQVSTTLFRAALNAGLPITERRAHAYRVGYYEQDAGPGLDATVYSPTTDFKFKNDTPGHILIQAYPDTKNLTLVFELYGTSDGRIAKTTKPLTTSQVAPPEDSYQDDPTLPAGVTKQIEHKAWGAKTTFNYEVTRGGEIVYQKTFVSNYRPWQAVYLRGVGPAQ